MFTKKDINNWCLELRDKINRAIRFGNEWEEKQKQKTKFKSQISIRTEEICKLIDDQFATINVGRIYNLKMVNLLLVFVSY